MLCLTNSLLKMDMNFSVSPDTLKNKQIHKYEYLLDSACWRLSLGHIGHLFPKRVCGSLLLSRIYI